MLGLVLQYHNQTKVIISVSSGARDVDNKDIKLKNRLENILKNSFAVEITGFTGSEAEEYASIH